jgi:iron complex transport system substrate-binding protein
VKSPSSVGIFFDHNRRKLVKKSSILVVVAAFALSACGAASPSASPSTAADTAYPLSITNNSKAVTIAAEPAAIISLSPTATEMLFAIGAGEQVIAVDDQSNFPAEAPISELSGYTPNIEAIVAKTPDLVIVSNDINNIVSSLEAASIPVLVEPAAVTIDDTYAQIAELGKVTNHADGAATVITDMKSKIAGALDSAKGKGEGKSVYHELDNTLYSVTSATFVGSIYQAFGLTNIADESPDASSGYPQLSAEFIIAANPSLVFLADTKCCEQNAAVFAARPGFETLTAATANGVISLDDDIASRWGPRTADLYVAIADALNSAA